MNRTLPETLEINRRSVYAVCFKVLRHAQDAEDAAQEALLEAARHAEAVRDPARFPAWLHRVALHTALDAMRRRRIRERHEGRVERQGERSGDERIEALYAALADLPDEDRRILVEHFIQEKTLREMAGPKECSEVAVWKRIERAKRRLREALALTGAGAAIALLPSEGFGATSVPAGLVKGGLVAVAVMLIAAVVIVRTRSRIDVTVPTSIATSVTALPERPFAERSSRSVEPSNSAPPKVVPRPPYPYRFPPPHWSPGLAAAWTTLRSKRLTIGVENEPLGTVLADLTLLTDVYIFRAPGVTEPTLNFFQAADIVLEAALRLALVPRHLSYELLDDGSIRVDTPDRVNSRILKEGQELEGVLKSLDTVRKQLAGGWDGLAYEAPEARIEGELRTMRVVTPQEIISTETRLAHLRDVSRKNIIIEFGIGEDLIKGLSTPMAWPVEEASMEAHLERLCHEFGLGFYVTSERIVLITTAERAKEARKGQMIDRNRRTEVLARLDRPMPVLPSSMPELLQTLERELDLKVLVSEKVWESSTAFSLPAGLTAREAIQQVAAQGGFRWALDYRLYLVDP
jgi:RNA polymerase sigma factor (sigma-70 family)